MADIGGEGRWTAASSQGRPVRENDAGASTQNRSLACDADAGCRAGADNGVWKARFLEQDLLHFGTASQKGLAGVPT